MRTAKGAEIANVDALRSVLSEDDWDVVHVCGHADSDGPVPALIVGPEGRMSAQLMSCALSGNGTTSPFLVFANICESAAPGREQSFAEALRLAGVSCVIGTHGRVTDDAALAVALRFYDLALQSHPFGSALYRARVDHLAADPADATALLFTLYGDPVETLGLRSP